MARKSKEKITSRPGFFGTMHHYDSKGKKIGESRPGFFGTTNHYDAKGRKTGSSMSGAFGRKVHFDEKGHRDGTSYSSIFGTDHYDKNGNRVGHSNYGGFGSQYSDFESQDDYTRVTRENRMADGTPYYNGFGESEDHQSYDYRESHASQEPGPWAHLSPGAFLWRVLVLILLWASLFMAIFNIAFFFIVGYCDFVGAILGAIVGIILIRYTRSWKEK